MDALSSLSGISVSSAIAPLAAPATVVRSQPATRISEPSVTTFFSDLALTLLEQEASDSSQGVDDAFANSLSNAAFANGAQLYTPNGILQPFVFAPFAGAQAFSSGISGGQNGQDAIAEAGAATTASNVFGSGAGANQALADLINTFRQPAPTNPALQNSSALPDSRGAAVAAVADNRAATTAQAFEASQSLLTPTALDRQTSLINQLTALSAQNAFASQATSPAITPIVVPPDLAAAPLDELPLSFDAARLATATTTVPERTTQTERLQNGIDVTADNINAISQSQADAEGINALLDPAEQAELDAQSPDVIVPEPGTETDAVIAQPDFAFFNNDAQVPFGLDEYQQAALASGFSAFGKELNTFVPASSETITQAAVGEVNAVTPVVSIGARADETAGA